jgi:hypothetical protein
MSPDPKQWLADGYVLAGYSIRNFGNTFMLKQYPTGEAFLDWRGGTDMGGTWKTIEVEVKGDQICRTFDNLALLCGSVYKLDGNTYVGVNQNDELSSVYVKLPKYDDMLKLAETVAPAVPGSN